MGNTTNVTLWWALVFALITYVVVAHVADVQPAADLPIGALFAALASLAAAMGVATVIYRRRALVEPIRSGALDPSGPPGQAKAFTVFILNMVLSESVGIYGLVLSFLSGDPNYAIGFCAMALALMYVHRPTASDLVPPLSRDGQASHSGPLHP